MADYVLNEWVWADASGENGPERAEQTLHALLRLLTTSGNRFILVEDAPFQAKMYKFFKTAVQMRERETAKLISSAIYDSAKCIKLPVAQLPNLSDALISALPRKDIYLVQAQAMVGESTIVTTDNRLLTCLRAADIRAELRDEFIARMLEP